MGSSMELLTLLDLPPQVMEQILSSGLAPADLLRVSCACRTLHATVQQAARAWLAALEGTLLLPRGVSEHLLQPLPEVMTWRDVCMGLRLVQPAAQPTIGLQYSQGTTVSCSSSQFPRVLHMDGTSQRTLQVAFPALPAGRYAVVWRMAGAQAFKRGRVNYLVVFKSGKRVSSASGVVGPLSTLLRSRASRQRHTLQSPSPSPAAPPAAAAVAGQQDDPTPDVVAAGQLGDRDLGLDAATGASVRGPAVPQLTFLAALRSRLRGTYHSHWHLVDRASLLQHQAPTGSLLPSFQPLRATTPDQPSVAAASAEGATVGGAATSDDGGDGLVWADIVLGEVVLRRTCAPRFVFALLQVARDSQVQGAGGILVDFVQLRRLE